MRMLLLLFDELSTALTERRSGEVRISEAPTPTDAVTKRLSVDASVDWAKQVAQVLIAARLNAIETSLVFIAGSH
jgi:hypothetical protein